MSARLEYRLEMLRGYNDASNWASERHKCNETFARECLTTYRKEAHCKGYGFSHWETLQASYWAGALSFLTHNTVSV